MAHLTIPDLCRRYNVSRRVVESWIRNGDLRAIDTAANTGRRHRWRVSEEEVAEFERRRSNGVLLKAKTPRRNRPDTSGLLVRKFSVG